MLLNGSDADAIERAADELAAGRLVAFPTETVYGLGARADDDRAVARIFAAKGRPADHPLIVHVADAAAAAAFAARWPPLAQRLTDAFWPGPLSLIVERRASVGAAAAAGQDSIGLRCPAHPVARALLRAAAQRGVAGVAAPSANPFGRISPTARGSRGGRFRRRAAGARWRRVSGRHRVEHRRLPRGAAGAAAPGRADARRRSPPRPAQRCSTRGRPHRASRAAWSRITRRAPRCG